MSIWDLCFKPSCLLFVDHTVQDKDPQEIWLSTQKNQGVEDLHPKQDFFFFLWDGGVNEAFC